MPQSEPTLLLPRKDCVFSPGDFMATLPLLLPIRFPSCPFSWPQTRIAGELDRQMGGRQGVTQYNHDMVMDMATMLAKVSPWESLYKQLLA
jgi:hypothetical protein